MKIKLKLKFKIKGWLAMACSYCQIIYGFKPSQADFSGISHGICPDCYSSLIKGNWKWKNSIPIKICQPSFVVFAENHLRWIWLSRILLLINVSSATTKIKKEGCIMKTKLEKIAIIIMILSAMYFAGHVIAYFVR